MRPSDPKGPDAGTAEPVGTDPTGDGGAGYTPPPELVESWDPADDERVGNERRQAHWNWHGRPSWGRRLVAVFPAAAIAAAAALVTVATWTAQGAIDQVQSVTGTGGATLVSRAPSVSYGGGSSGGGQLADYQQVTFSQPSGPVQPIQGSTSLALPPYVSWEANGSAGAANGLTVARRGQLLVGVRRPTPGFKGWFLTATGTTPASCAFQFSAASPPPLTVSSPQAIGELVMAVQTSDTIRTGDINYVFVAELVTPGGQRFLSVGYARGHVSHAVEHVLKKVPWQPGPLDVAIRSNGGDRLAVWIDGTLFYQGTGLQLGIVPPFQPYLEVQARATPYTVAYNGYSSVCQDDIVVDGLPDGSVATLDGRRTVATGGSATFPTTTITPPVTGRVSVTLPDGSAPVRFARHTYWPGARYSFAPGS